MALTASAGPQVTYGITVSSSGGTGEYNEARGPSLNDLGNGMMDPRSQYNYGYNPGQPAATQIYGFWGQTAIVDYIPGAISSNNIALKQIPAAATALTLAASGTTTTSVSIVAPETGKVVSGLICIDAPCGGSTNATVQFGSAGSIGIWNPASVCGRCITILASGTGGTYDGGSWSISGRDVYGFKVTELLPVTAAGSVAISAKAYKYISSIIAATTINSTAVMVGTADSYGFPFLVQHPAYAQIWVGATSSATLITTNVGNHAFGSSLAVATSTNGDVRGTYASSVASNGTTMRVAMIISPEVGVSDAALSSYSGLNQISPTNFYSLFGATQFSSV